MAAWGSHLQLPIMIWPSSQRRSEGLSLAYSMAVM